MDSSAPRPGNSDSDPGEAGTDDRTARVRVENIGGISRCDVSFEPGVTLLTGRNATNRTSFLTALADVIGGPTAAMKSDADTARIELSFNGSTYSREYTRKNGALVSQGTQYTDRTGLVELFATLLADNPARTAVERGGDLREILMRPVDTAEIEREIETYRRERSNIESQIADIERERERLPELEERRTTLEAKIEEVTADIEAVNARIDEYEADREQTERAEELIDELDELRMARQETERKIEDREDEITRLEGNLREVEEALAETSVPETEIETAKSELERLRAKKRTLEETIGDLQRIVSFNQEILADDGGVLGSEMETTDVAGELDPDSREVSCWTCGSVVEQTAIDDQLDELRGVIQQYRRREQEVDADIEELEERLDELERHRDRRDDLGSKRRRLEQQIAVQKDEIEELRERHDEIEADLDAVEQRVEETEEFRGDDRIEAYQELSDLEYERGRLENELAAVAEEIEEIEALTDDREQLKARHDRLTDDLDSLRSRIDDLESEAVEQFNTHMDAVLDALGYDNVARIWIERIAAGSEDEAGEFVLHIVRKMEDGTVYEDSAETLSESEREVIGLVVALAGYLIYDVHEEVPFMLLDSLEAIDSDRIAALVEYFSEFASFLLVALLPEDADAVDTACRRLTSDRFT